jgi:16S rRNA (guanine966-N2)-methyltransferase
MRVMAGTLGGRRLAVPPGHTTRPTSELVRGAVFNSLVARGEIADAVVADLFAGSGALGIEAISRGAARAVFVEHDRLAAQVIAANLAALGVTDQGRIEVLDVEHWVPEMVDVVLADPPYGWGGWADLLSRLRSLGDIRVVAEADHPVEAEGWEVVAQKRYGGTVVSQLRPRGAIST